ncbi:MAG: secretin N-terminal domain-containing protein [Proteobacteria bacterium]|nr:secretin N-terminal domain-containing protein [Pseudomonadota bacterium]
MMFKKIILFVLILFVSGCAELGIESEPLEPSSGHINIEESPAAESEIPALVEQAPVLPEPGPVEPLERYTVVVNEVPVKELLFALARDAKINVDIHPAISGVVTINAVEQTLPQILKRITRQVDIRYEYEGDNLFIVLDEPFFRIYEVGYLNLSRETSGSVTVSTQIASTSSGGDSGGGGGRNTSTTSITSESHHEFWENLETSITAIIGGSLGSGADSNSIVVNPESGLITVSATASQHEQIQGLIDRTLESIKRQVLIQATVVEVDLSDQYQHGIDWTVIGLGGAGFALGSNLLGGAGFVIDEIGNLGLANPGLNGPPVTSSTTNIEYFDADASGQRLNAIVSLLSEFGETRVLSSPQIMVLNNHTAVLKVVENFVYFEVEQEIESGNALTGTGPLLATTTTARTIPIGLVLTVIPQISRDDSVILNVRPTISSVVRTEIDPNPALVLVRNEIPVVRVREMESILRVNSNQIAVLGGLMQDTIRNRDRKTPFLADLPLVGNLFKAVDRESIKSELVIFLRPIVIKNASLDGDLKEYRPFLNPDRYEKTSSVIE